MFSKNTHFLVVDDFMTMRKIVKKILNELGYQNISEAADGVEAYKILTEKKAQGTPIDMVISDWNMPNCTGLDLLKRVRASQDFPKLPFMLVTAESEQSQIIEAAKSGVSDYVVKPFSGAILKSKLEKVYLKHNPVGKVG